MFKFIDVREMIGNSSVNLVIILNELIHLEYFIIYKYYHKKLELKN